MEDLDFEAVLAEENRKKVKHLYHKSKPYGTRKTRAVQSIYIIASVLWIGLVYLLNLYQTDFFGYIILLIPIFVFAFSFLNATNISAEVEEDLYKANYLSIGLVIVLPLLTWFSNDYKGCPEKRRKFMTIIITALILTLFSLVDIWIGKKWYTVVKHVKSVLQTLSLTLIIYALYMYYVERVDQECVSINP